MTGVDLQVWQRLALPEHAALVRAAMSAEPGDVASVSRLRKLGDAELVRAALQLAEARRKAAAKFGERAAELWADPQGVEMASSALSAGYKAARMAAVLGRADVLDVCCGIGGDAMAMAGVGLNATCVDLDPMRAWMAGRNAGVAAVVGDAADVGNVGPGVRGVHIDPARRTEGGRRVFRLADLTPGPEVVRALVERVARQAGDGAWGVCVKLGPGVDAGELSQIAGEHAWELEIISERGRLTQGVVWIGSLALRARSATLLNERGVHTLVGEPDASPAVGGIGRYVFEPDDSVERAGLRGELCGRVGAWMPHVECGLLTADAVIEHPMLTGFEVLAEMGWNERRVRETLRDFKAGIVEVKTRGGVVDTDAMQASLRGDGGEALVVFVLRMGAAVRAIVARRA